MGGLQITIEKTLESGKKLKDKSQEAYNKNWENKINIIDSSKVTEAFCNKIKI